MFVGIVSTIVLMVTFLIGFDASLAVGTPELVQSASNA